MEILKYVENGKNYCFISIIGSCSPNFECKTKTIVGTVVVFFRQLAVTFRCFV